MDKPVPPSATSTRETTTLFSPAPLEEQSELEEQDDLGYDEPSCRWSPTGKSEQDCGEGLICPPCD